MINLWLSEPFWFWLHKFKKEANDSDRFKRKVSYQKSTAEQNPESNKSEQEPVAHWLKAKLSWDWYIKVSSVKKQTRYQGVQSQIYILIGSIYGISTYILLIL